MYDFDEIRTTDPEIADVIKAEMERQNSHIELIASENWVSKAVMAAMGSPLTNKYAEGYPGKRYYGGCQCVDVAEDLARERARELFRLRVCECSAPFRSTGKYGCILCYPSARGHIYGNESGSWRTSDSWFTGKYVR